MVDMGPQHYQALRRLGSQGQACQYIAPGAAFLLQPNDGSESDVWNRYARQRCTAVQGVLETLQCLASAVQEPIGHVVCDGEGAEAGASQGRIEGQRHQLLFDLAVGTTHQHDATGTV